MASREVNIWIRLHNRATKELGKLRAQFLSLRKWIRKAGTAGNIAFSTMRAGMQSLAMWAQRVLFILTAMAIYLAKNFVKGVITASAEAERFALQLDRISDSAKQAEKDMDWVRKFAAKTPFYTQEVVTSFNMLRAIGVKNIREIITVAGDAAFLMGRDITEVAMSFISLHRRMWRRLGVDLIRTGKKVRIVTSRMVIETEHNLEAIRKGLLEVMQVTFGGTMKNAEKIWSGMTALFWSEWWEFKVKLGESGVFIFLKAGLRLVLDWIKRMKTEGKLDEWAQKISAEMITMGIVTITTLAKMAEKTKSVTLVFNWMAKVVTNLARAVLIWHEGIQRIAGSERLANYLKGLRNELDLNMVVMRAYGKELKKSITLGTVERDVADFLREVRNLAASGAVEYKHMEDSLRGASNVMSEMRDSQKEQFNMATQFAAATAEEQSKFVQALKLRKDMTQERFDDLENLRTFVASNKILSGVYAGMLDKWKEKYFDILIAQGQLTKEEADEIKAKAGILTLDETRLKVEKEITGEIKKQTIEYEKQIKVLSSGFRLIPLGGNRFAWRDPSASQDEGPRPTQPWTFRPSGMQQATNQAAIAEAANAAVQQRMKGEADSAAAAARLSEMVSQLTMENNWNIDYTIDVNPEKLAEEISNRFRGVIAENMEEMIPLLQGLIKDFQAKAQAADAARKQVEAN